MDCLTRNLRQRSEHVRLSIMYHAAGNEIPTTCFQSTSRHNIILIFVSLLFESPFPRALVWIAPSEPQGAWGGLDFNLIMSIAYHMVTEHTKEAVLHGLIAPDDSEATPPWQRTYSHLKNDSGSRKYKETSALISVHSVPSRLTACVAEWLTGKPRT